MELTFIDSIKNGFGRLMEAVYPDLAQKFNFRILYEALFPFLALAAGIAALWLLTRPFSKFRRYFFVVGTVAVIIFLAVGVLAPEYMETADKWVEDQINQLEETITGKNQADDDIPPIGAVLDRWASCNMSVNFRSAPRTDTSNVIYSLTKDTLVWVNTVVTGADDSRTEWYRVLFNNREGYIQARYVSLKSKEESDKLQAQLPTPVPTHRSVGSVQPTQSGGQADIEATAPYTTPAVTGISVVVVPANPVSPTPSVTDGAQGDGVNLLSGGLQERASSNGFLEYKVREVLSPYVGQTVTVSFDIMPDTDERIRVYPYQDSGVSIADTGWFDLKAGTYTRVSMTTTVKDHGQKTGYTTGGIGIYNDSRNSFTVRRMKIELGGQATAFSLAPQDPLRGRNLLPGYAEEHTTINGRLLVPVQSALESYVGLTVNVSFDLKCSDSREISASAYQNRGVSIGSDAESQAVFTTSPGQYVRFSFSTVVTKYNQGSGMLQLLDTSLIKKSFSIQRLKIELGEETTGWSPAPEDAG